MGSGKTKVSKALEAKLGIKRFSTDEIIEQCEGMAIGLIFKQNGEDYFRHIEAQVVRDLALQENIIVDCGGGVVLNLENILQLKQKGKVFFLNASAETIYSRVKDDTRRPLLQVPNPLGAIVELMNKRLPLYQEAADVIIDTNNPSLDSAVVEILKEM